MAKESRSLKEEKKHTHNLFSKITHAFLGHHHDNKDVKKVTKDKNMDIVIKKKSIDKQIQDLIAQLDVLQTEREQLESKVKKAKKSKSKSKVKIKAKAKDKTKEHKKKDSQIENKDKIVKKDLFSVKKSMKDNFIKDHMVKAEKVGRLEEKDPGLSMLQLLRDVRDKGREMKPVSKTKLETGEPTNVVKKNAPPQVSMLTNTMPSKAKPAKTTTDHATIRKNTYTEEITRPIKFGKGLKGEYSEAFYILDLEKEFDPSNLAVIEEADADTDADTLKPLTVLKQPQSTSDVGGGSLAQTRSFTDLIQEQIQERHKSMNAEKEISKDALDTPTCGYSKSVDYREPDLTEQLSTIMKSKQRYLNDSVEETKSEIGEEEWSLLKADIVSIDNPPPPLPRNDVVTTKTKTCAIQAPADHRQNPDNNDTPAIPQIKVTTPEAESEKKDVLTDFPPLIPPIPARKDKAIKEEANSVASKVPAPIYTLKPGTPLNNQMVMQLEIMKLKLEMEQLKMKEKELELANTQAANEAQRFKIVASLLGNDVVINPTTLIVEQDTVVESGGD